MGGNQSSRICPKCGADVSSSNNSSICTTMAFEDIKHLNVFHMTWEPSCMGLQP